MYYITPLLTTHTHTHTHTLTHTQGQLFSWGDDTTGQLGLGPKAGRQATPREVVLNGTTSEGGETYVVGASGGWGHTCAVTSGGAVWSWGFGGAHCEKSSI